MPQEGSMDRMLTIGGEVGGGGETLGGGDVREVHPITSISDTVNVEEEYFAREVSPTLSSSSSSCVEEEYVPSDDAEEQEDTE
ncbi:hypothetical protein Tco_0189546 [Tanacetum coccineum]